MQTKQLGNSDLQITPIGIGAWAMGGGNWEWSWGPQNDHDSMAAIHQGLDLGINWIDTAAVYGLGHSEKVVGRALKERRERPYVFTKCSLVWNKAGTISHNLKAASIRREAEGSLKRLGVERIDLYQIHWPAWKGAAESASPGSIEEAVATLEELRHEGKIRYFGVSNFDVPQMTRALAVASITSLQPPYSLLARGIEDAILPFAELSRIGVIVYSPMYSGLLTGAMTRERIARFSSDDWRRRNPNFQEPLLSRNLRVVELLRTIASRHGRMPGEVAIAWTLRHSAVTGAIVGVRSREQVRGVVGAAEFQLSDTEAAEIEKSLGSEAA